MIPQAAAAALRFSYRSAAGETVPFSRTERGDDRLCLRGAGISFDMRFQPEIGGIIPFSAELDCEYPTVVRIGVAGRGTPVIPGCMVGDNRARDAAYASFPHLTKRSVPPFSAPEWSFRLSRATYPAAFLLGGEVWGVSLSPYGTEDENGVYARADGECGVTLGFQNIPVTFVNKEHVMPPEEGGVKRVLAAGHLFAGLSNVAAAMRFLHGKYARMPQFSHKIEEYISALAQALKQSWQIERGQFCDLTFSVGSDEPPGVFRYCPEIGWTGGANLYYPLLKASGGDPLWQQRCRNWFDRLALRFNPASGLLFDLETKTPGLSGWGRPCGQVNGWWAGYLVADCHSAYTNGTAAYYWLKAEQFDRRENGVAHPDWVEAACRVLDTVAALQRSDGNLGYAYCVGERRVAEWRGCAGCWFAAALALAYRLTGRDSYGYAAERALAYYRRWVKRYSCYGTPMDTRWAPDEEGNLAFVKAAGEMYAATGKKKYLRMLEEGAQQEYLWRYCYAARPLHEPLRGRYNSCGGSVTSASNPHIHPMACLIYGELRCLSETVGDSYHAQRAEEGLANFMQAADLWAEHVSGRLGFMSERYCPSDGLTEERYPKGSASSTWFTHNAWAAAALLDGLQQRLDCDKAHRNGPDEGRGGRLTHVFSGI